MAGTPQQMEYLPVADPRGGAVFSGIKSSLLYHNYIICMFGFVKGQQISANCV